MAGCFLAALGVLFLGRFVAFSPAFIAAEVLVTVVALFVFGSTKYRLDKNALTYGTVMIIGATFATGWQRQTNWGDLVRHYLFSLHGLNELFHADTMLFILGLTFFVAVIAQTRILESVSFAILTKFKGQVLPTVALLAAIVSAASGVLDGVSMIGLMIRTLIIILLLSKAGEEAVVFAVIVSTVTTTVCGMWLAYGEPPNLIMKSNLHPHLTNAFFLRYCLPVAVGSYFIVLYNLRKRLKGREVVLKKLDILDIHTADVRFIQASRHGKVLTPVEFVEEKKEVLGKHFEPVLERLHEGEPLGKAMVAEKVASAARRQMLGEFVSENLAEVLDEHYADSTTEKKLSNALENARKKRIRAQMIGGLSFIPFIGLLIAHAINHDVPLFWASFAGFGVAVFGIISISKMRNLALHEGLHEYREYLFLFPLFLSITMLQKSGFFTQIEALIHSGIENLGVIAVALLQYIGALSLSALLDNNVVADFAGRALLGLDVTLIHLFAMAQIAGYAAGGCWTHIGSAQSVVAYSFIKREINNRYTPFQWIKAMTPIVVEISIWMIAVIYIESFFKG